MKDAVISYVDLLLSVLFPGKEDFLMDNSK